MPRPSRPWFRFYSEALESRKAQSLEPRLFKHWVNLLCLANITKPRGTLPTLQNSAFALRLDTHETNDILQELKRQRFLDKVGNRYKMHDWPEWQFESDANLTPGRVNRAHNSHGGNTKGTPRERGRNAVGTPLRVADPDPDPDTEQIARDAIEFHPPRRGPARAVVVGFEQSFGRLLSPTELELIKALEEEHPNERIEYALREAAALNKRSVRYVQRTCERMANDGDSTDNGGWRVGGNGRVAPDVSVAAELARYGRPPVFVVDPGGVDTGETGQHTAPSAGGLEVS